MKLVLLIISSVLVVNVLSQRDRSRTRDGKKLEGRTTVVSCRVFRKGVCNRDSKNILTVNQSITNSRNCQQFCYSTNGCSAFTHFNGVRGEPRKCVLFKDCNGKLAECKDCISGPIMPRINECLAAKQEVAPPTTEGTRKPCTFGCTSVCVGPRCPEILSGIQSGEVTELINTPRIFPSQETSTSTDFAAIEPSNLDQIDVPDIIPIDQPNEQGGGSEISSYDEVTDVTVDESIFGDDSIFEEDPDTVEPDYEYPNYDAEYNTDYNEYNYDDDDDDDTDINDYDNYEYEYNDEAFEVETMDEGPLEEEAVIEEEDEIPDEDINIDAGFLNDNRGNTVELPPTPARSSVVTTNFTNSPTFVFFFCAVGGMNHNGPINAVDILSQGLSNALQALTIAPMPNKATKGGECTAAYTDRSITSCNSGYTVLSPYGFLYKPGSCYDYNLDSNDWKKTGAKLTTYRKGGTMTKLGRYLMATGGYRGKRALRTIELYDPKKPERGWKKMAKLTMPTSVSQHCTVTVKGRAGKEVIITGGKGRENRAIKLDVNSSKWYSLNRLNEGRRKHACVKAKLNGRTGIVVSGGINKSDKNMTSVEFYDAASGEWYTLPRLRKGRQNHAMVVNKGKLMVAGGVGMGAKGKKEFLDDVEVFTGQRWVKSNMKLDRPRAGFSLVKIPRSGRSISGKNKSSRPAAAGMRNKNRKSPKQNRKSAKKAQRTPRRN